MSPRVARFGENPLLHAGMDLRIGTNLNGPSLIRVPEWVSAPLGRYYLYFAHHQGPSSAWRTPTTCAAPGPCTAPAC